jgi:hypothetical protein
MHLKENQNQHKVMKQYYLVPLAKDENHPDWVRAMKAIKMHGLDIPLNADEFAERKKEAVKMHGHVFHKITNKVIQATDEEFSKLDGRLKNFKEKLRRLGYLKNVQENIVITKQIMEAALGDFGMASDAGNKKIARAVAQAKNPVDLKNSLSKISRMAGGKYAEAGDDDVIDTAMDAFKNKKNSKGGQQDQADRNIFNQIKKAADGTRPYTVTTDDLKKFQFKADDAKKVYSMLNKVKPQLRLTYIQLLQKDKRSFQNTVKKILAVAQRLGR